MDQFSSIATSVMGTLLLGVAGYIANQMKRLTDGVEQLNLKMAVVVERVDSHEKRLSKLET